MQYLSDRTAPALWGSAASPGYNLKLIVQTGETGPLLFALLFSGSFVAGRVQNAGGVSGWSNWTPAVHLPCAGGGPVLAESVSDPGSALSRQVTLPKPQREQLRARWRKRRESPALPRCRSGLLEIPGGTFRCRPCGASLESVERTGGGTRMSKIVQD
jgi:hypothetical protein